MFWVAESHSCAQDLRLDIVLIDESFRTWNLGDPDLWGGGSKTTMYPVTVDSHIQVHMYDGGDVLLWLDCRVGAHFFYIVVKKQEITTVIQ